MPQHDTPGDLYALLGVQRNATLSAIRIAYRGKVAQHHPNTGGDPEVFARVREAYGVLISGQRRAHYDATGEVLPIEDAAAAARGPPRPPGPGDGRAPPEGRSPEPGTGAPPAAGCAPEAPEAEPSPRPPPAEPPASPGAGRGSAGASAGGGGAAPCAEGARTAPGPEGDAHPAALRAFHDAPAKEKPLLSRCALEQPHQGSTAAAMDARELAASEQPAVEEPANCARLSGNSPESTFSGSSPSTSSTDLDSQEGSNASSAAPDARQASPLGDEVQAASGHGVAAPRKVQTLAEALAAAEAMADAADESTLDPDDVPAKPKGLPAAESPEEEKGLPELEAIVDCDGPPVYRCSQGVLFGKRSVEPTGSNNMIKLARPIGTYIYSTGRRWKGPSGGTWCELAASHVSSDNVRWMLVKGPGFGLSGPALIDVSVLKTGGPYEAACLKVCRVGYRESDTVVFASFMSKEATMWGVKKAIQEATGLNAQRIYLSAGEASGQQSNLLSPVQDEQSIRSLIAQDDDLRLFLVYTGDFGRDYNPGKTY